MKLLSMQFSPPLDWTHGNQYYFRQAISTADPNRKLKYNPLPLYELKETDGGTLPFLSLPVKVMQRSEFSVDLVEGLFLSLATCNSCKYCRSADSMTQGSSI
jgi:hypothetical protein